MEIYVCAVCGGRPLKKASGYVGEDQFTSLAQPEVIQFLLGFS